MKINKYDILKVVLVLLVFGSGLTWAYHILKPQKRLPYYNPSQLDKRLVDESVQGIGRGHKTLNFKLINQDGDSISQEIIENKIFVADFFFTTCPSICKDMAVQKRRLQDTLMHENFMILSHSVTPEMDSVPVLKAYADLQGANAEHWQIFTGDKKQIYKLARQSYFAVLDEGGNGDEYDFIHTENFVLVDKNRKIRGFYDGTKEEEVNRLIEDFYILKEEQSAK